VIHTTDATKSWFEVFSHQCLPFISANIPLSLTSLKIQM